MGFEYFYGFIGGDTDQWHAVSVPRTRPRSSRGSESPSYNLTTDMADDAIATCASCNAAAPDKPFFVYYVPGGTHAPHQPTKEWIEKFKGKFDKGWNDSASEIFANQKRLGVDPADTQADALARRSCRMGRARRRRKEALRPPGRGVRRLRCAYTDHEIGRVIEAVEDLGKLDNTLVIYISGDNGASAEGSPIGTADRQWRPSRASTCRSRIS